MLTDFIKLLKLDKPYIMRRPRVICSDGFSVSIQAGYGMYSTPRTFFPPYTHVELGFPSHYEQDILDYAESFSEIESPTETVYPYVPIEVIYNALTKHGVIQLVSDEFLIADERMREIYKLF